MGVGGLWDFLEKNNIKGKVVTNEALTSQLNGRPTIAVDFIGLFHETIRRHFFLVEKSDYDKASAKVLLEAETLLPEKEKFMLFINGFHTIEHNARSQRRNKYRKYAYWQLVRMLRESRYDVPELKKHIKNVFHVSIRMRASLARVAQQLGWQAVYSTGDSDVHIAKYGGTVITNDSDFFFFTNITGVIFHRQLIEEDLPHFVYYEKRAVLDALSLSEEKWIALGIVLTKDFNLSQTHLQLDATYQLLRNHVDEDGTHTEYIERYIEVISRKSYILLKENETRLSPYKVAFQIYVDMEQHLMEYNNIAEYYEDLIVQRPYYYFLKGFFFFFKKKKNVIN